MDKAMEKMDRIVITFVVDHPMEDRPRWTAHGILVLGMEFPSPGKVTFDTGRSRTLSGTEVVGIVCRLLGIDSPSMRK